MCPNSQREWTPANHIGRCMGGQNLPHSVQYRVKHQKVINQTLNMNLYIHIFAPDLLSKTIRLWLEDAKSQKLLY